MKIKIAIAEDNPLTRKQYSEQFGHFKEIEILFMAKNGLDLLNKLNSSNKLPDVVLMDIEMPELNGIETTAVLKDKYPSVEVMMLTVFEDENKIFKAIKAGASGYLLKDSTPDEIAEAVKEIIIGGAPVSKSIARNILKFIRGEKPKRKDEEKINITKREMDILKAIVDDDTEYAIAMNLGLSEHTVRTHIKNIYKKLQVHSRAAVVKAVYEKNLFNK